MRQRCGGFRPARSRPRRTQSFDCASFWCPIPRAAVGHGTVCLAATRGSRRRMRLTDFCFPTTSTTSTRVPSIPGMVTGLSPDSSTGDRAFHDATIRFGGPLWLGWRTFSFLPPAEGPNLWHPCRLPRRRPPRFREREPFGGRQTASLARPWRRPIFTIEGAFHRRVTSPSWPAAFPWLVHLALPFPGPVVLPPRAGSRPLFARSFHPLVRGGLPCELDPVHVPCGPLGIRAEHASLVRTSPVRLLQL